MHEFTFKTSSRTGGGRRLARAVMTVMADFVDDMDIIHELDLALTEACANVIRHAYPDENGDLEIILRVKEGSHVDLAVTDWGCGLDPDKIVFEAPDPKAEGGRGFFLMKKLSDEFEVNTCGERNSVIMRRFIKEDSWKT